MNLIAGWWATAIAYALIRIGLKKDAEQRARGRVEEPVKKKGRVLPWRKRAS